MDHFELVEKLKAKSGVSFEEAKRILEENDWDLLDAIVALERGGKIRSGAQAGDKASELRQDTQQEDAEPDGPAEPKFTKAGAQISSWAESGNRNFLLISRFGKEKTRIPMTVVIAALLICLALFPIIPLLTLALVVSLLLGFRYNIVGPSDHSKVNRVMDQVGSTADQVTETMKTEWNKITK